jgi:predicted outer membrane repeat protein
MTRQWLSALKVTSPAPRQGYRKRRRARMNFIEVLEDRVVLSPTIYTVDSTGQDTSGTGLSGTLPYVVGLANSNTNSDGSEIEFDPTVFSGSAVARINLSAALALSETDGPEVVDGPGASAVIINTSGYSQVFVVDSGVTAALDGLSIYNGEGNLGGCIDNAGALTVTNCQLVDGIAVNGGGIYNAGVLTISKSGISGCSTQDGDGAGIDNVGTLSAGGCTFSSDKAQGDAQGGGEGGGIYVQGGVVTLTNCTVGDCSATAGGGGVFSAGTLNLVNTSVYQNEALSDSDGGGLYNDGGKVTASGSSDFEYNTAGGNGGAIYNQSGTVATNECNVEDNFVTQLGDGSGIFNAGVLTLTNTTLTNNGSTNSDDYYTDQGGGIFNSGNVTIDGGSLTGNKADDGGNIENSGILTIESATIQNGEALTEDGGGIRNASGGTLSLSGSTIAANNAEDSGGGIDNDGVATITNCTFYENSSAIGGAIESAGSLTFVCVTIDYNWVTAGAGSGGGIDVQAGSTSLYDTIVERNLDGLGQGPEDDVAGTVSGSYDLIGTGGAGGLTNTDGNQVGVAYDDLHFGQPADYGGTTVSFPLLPGSPAIGAGSSSIPGVSVPTTDQRGVGRPADSVDVGAFQDQGFTITLDAGGSPQTAILNQPFTNPLEVEVSSSAGDPVADGAVTFMAPSSGPSATLYSVPALIGTSGEASVTATANGSAGTYSVVASASGASSPVAFTLTNQSSASSPLGTTTALTSSPNPSVVGQNVSFTAVVAPASGSGTPTGTVTFTIDGQSQTPVTLAVVDGVDEALFSTSILTAGSHTISAAYSSDSTFAASATTAPLTQTVDAGTTTSLSSSANPSVIGESVTFTATVDSTGGGGTPSGSVRFYQGSTTLQTVSLDASGQATFTASALAIGTDDIAAVYTATGDFLSSDSAPVMQAVNSAPLQNTSTLVTSSGNPSIVGQTVVFTAIVTPEGGSGAPTGTVTFTINGKASSPIPLIAATGTEEATDTLPSLATGSYTITASYSGDSNFSASASTTNTQVVNPSPVGPTLVTPAHADGPTVVSVRRYGYHMMPTTVDLTFDQALDAATAEDDANYRIIGPAGKVIGIKSADYNPGTLTVTLHPQKRISIHHTYKLIVDGTAPHGLTNAAGLLLDGVEDGQPDSNYRTSLTWRNLVLDRPVRENSRKQIPPTVFHAATDAKTLAMRAGF